MLRAGQRSTGKVGEMGHYSQSNELKPRESNPQRKPENGPYGLAVRPRSQHRRVSIHAAAAKGI